MADYKKREELLEENEKLQRMNDEFEARLQRMEAMVAEQRAAGEYRGPEPVLYHDPFDVAQNPHHIIKHPDGKVLSWKNPNIRNGSRGWRGWVPVCYDDEIGLRLTEYIPDPPAKMEGSAEQDNYVRRGTDSILCWLDEEIWNARQQKREAKALRKQQLASNVGNTRIQPGVDTFGDGVQQEQRPVGGFKPRVSAEPLTTAHPAKRTEMPMPEPRDSEE
jgi:hypothetical protein